MKYYVLIVICSYFLISISQECYSQVPDEKQINAIKGRKILVLQVEPDPEILLELQSTNPSLLDNYKEAFLIYNSNLKAAIESFWTSHQKFEFVTDKQIKDLKKTKNTECAIIYTMSISATGVAKYNFKCDIEDVLNGSLNSHKSTNSGIYALCIDLIEDYANGKNPIASMPSNRFLPTKTEMACMVSVLNSYFVEGADIQNKNYDIYLLNENKNNCKTLRDMTLIVNENNLAKELRYNDIIPIYPFKVIVMPDNSVDSTIYSKTPGYAFLFAYPEYQFTSGSAYMRYFVINCNGGDNTILCSTNKLAFKIKQPKLMTQEQSYQDNDVKFIDRNVFEALTSMLKSK